MTIRLKLKQDVFDEVKMNPEFIHEIKPFEIWIKMPSNVDDTFLLKTDKNQLEEVLDAFSNILIKYIKKLYPEKDRGLININTGKAFVTHPILEGQEAILSVICVV